MFSIFRSNKKRLTESMPSGACFLFYLFFIPFRTKRIFRTRTTEDSKRIFCVYLVDDLELFRSIIWKTRICERSRTRCSRSDKIEIHISSDSLQLNPISERIARRHLFAAGESVRRRHTDNPQRHTQTHAIDNRVAQARLLRDLCILFTFNSTRNNAHFSIWHRHHLLSHCIVSHFRMLLITTIIIIQQQQQQRVTSQRKHSSLTHIKNKRNTNSR